MAVTLCACDKGQSIEDIKKSTDYLFTQSITMQEQLTSLQSTYLLHDIEHKKVVGILHKIPPLQVGNAVVWDDDVYQVEAIRLLSQKRGEEKIGETTLKRTADVEVFVKFLGKAEPYDKSP